MSTSVEERLQQLGIVLPAASEPAAKYANFVQVGSLLFISGKGPTGGTGGAAKRQTRPGIYNRRRLSVCAASRH